MRHLLPILAAVALWGCQLTDHSERTEVTTEDIQFGRSGYEEVDPGELPRIEFPQREQDMGRVVQGAKVEKRFAFTNSG